MPQAIERLFATPMMRPRLPAIKALFSFMIISAENLPSRPIGGLIDTTAGTGPQERKSHHGRLEP
jgi:hypothetical protein